MSPREFFTKLTKHLPKAGPTDLLDLWKVLERLASLVDDHDLIVPEIKGTFGGVEISISAKRVPRNGDDEDGER